MNRQKQQRERRKAAGICVRCGWVAAEGKVMCYDCLEDVRVKALAWQEQLKADMLAAYGAFCARCGSTEDLQFHHINGDGAQHREALSGDSQGGGWKSWQDLRRRGFPPIMLTLCFWCHKKEHGQNI